MLKELLFGTAPGYFKIKTGIAKGLTLLFDPKTESSKILGRYEIEIQKYFKSFSKKCDFLLDIGSFDGYYSLIYRKFNPPGKILACEAGNIVIDRIQENVKHNFNETGNFTVINKYIGNRIEKDHITVDRLVSGETALKYFLKIDVEGAEMEVLQGAEETLSHCACCIIIETHSRELEASCISFLNSLGYPTKIIKNSIFNRLRKKGRILEHNRWLVASQN